MTIKQDWQRERLMKNKHSLSSIAIKIRSIADDPSTTNAEAQMLRTIEMKLDDVIGSFNCTNSHTISFEKYNRIKEGVKANGQARCRQNRK